MGFSLGNGLSAAGYAAGEMYAKGALMDAQNEQEINRAMRLAEFKSALDSRTAEAARQGQVARIDAKAGALADEAIAPKRGLIDAGIADKESWTAEQQAAVDQSLGMDKKAIAADSRTREMAAVATGDISPKDAAAIERDQRKLDVSERTLAQKERLDLEKEDRKDARAREAEDARDRRQLQAMAAMEARAQMVAAGGRVPVGYRKTADGNLEAIPGGPADASARAGKPLPITAAKGLMENQENLRRAQKALALISGGTVDGVKGDPQATGKKGFLPNQILSRIDEAGVDTRAAIADMGSLVIHDRSGAAVTAIEFPRLAPFIPTEKDQPETAKKKLGLFVQNYKGLIEDATEFYRESGYKVPVEKLKNFEGDKATKDAAPRKEGGATGGWGIREVKPK